MLIPALTDLLIAVTTNMLIIALTNMLINLLIDMLSPAITNKIITSLTDMFITAITKLIITALNLECIWICFGFDTILCKGSHQNKNLVISGNTFS